MYCYPEEITDELIQTIKEEPKVCHYLDIPIQHCNDDVLKRMGRRTRKAELLDTINKLSEEIPDIALRTTLISGFPGESQEAHEELYNFVNEVEFDRLGVFTYSPEEGTLAEQMEDQIEESLKEERRDELMLLQQEISADKSQEYIDKIMSECGLQTFHKDRYPHEFSGGQRQRICIARALALNPSFVVCDEPVSALDVSIQAQIINLLKGLQTDHNLTYLFISHDLSVVEHISDTIGVMYLGNLVETGSKEDIFRNPLHPYTKALFSAIPMPDPDVKMNRVILEGSIPSPANPPKGCKFHTRCRYCMKRCGEEEPATYEVEPGHYVTCHLYDGGHTSIDEAAAHQAEKSAE